MINDKAKSKHRSSAPQLNTPASLPPKGLRYSKSALAVRCSNGGVHAGYQRFSPSVPTCVRVNQHLPGTTRRRARNNTSRTIPSPDCKASADRNHHLCPAFDRQSHSNTRQQSERGNGRSLRTELQGAVDRQKRARQGFQLHTAAT